MNAGASRRGGWSRGWCVLALVASASLAAPSCAPSEGIGSTGGEEPGGDPNEEIAGEDQTVDGVVVDTSTPAARAQYDANVSYALSYRARCVSRGGSRPRVLVTGFGRFLSNPPNATGMLVSKLVPAARYPVTERPGEAEHQADRRGHPVEQDHPGPGEDAPHDGKGSAACAGGDRDPQCPRLALRCVGLCCFGRGGFGLGHWR